MDKFRGVIFVVLGAASYGLLATFVKLANIQGLDTSVLTFYQYFLGFISLSAIAWFNPGKNKAEGNASQRSKLKLILFGTSLGLTSCFYYLSLQYIPVSVAIILLMQAIWMGGVLESILERSKPDRLKVMGSIIVLTGTFLAVDVSGKLGSLNYAGLGYGLLASISYTVTLMATNKIALELPTITRSKYLVLGGFITTVLFWNLRLLEHIQVVSPALLLFGLFLAVFGTIFPPILFNKGFPVIGIGLGSILSAIEIPVSIFSAKILLGEEVKTVQWLGVLIILISVVIINFQHIKRET